MGFGGSGGGASGIASAGDVALNNPAQSQALAYNTSISKWQNTSIALATGGGGELVVSLPAVTGAATLNLANGNIFNITLSGNATLTFTGATPSGASSFGVYVTQGAGGNHLITWPASVKWPGGTAPILSAGAAATDIIVFESLNGGTTWFGAFVGANYQ